MGDRLYYIYEHWRTDRDECFYVGKGKGKRANQMATRNAHHKAIQAKLARLGSAVEVRIIADGLSEEEAFALEIERIRIWRMDGADLTNKTDGGEGGSNPHPETRAKMRAAKVGRKLTVEHRAKIGEASRKAAAQPGAKAKLSAAIRESHARPEVKAKLSHHQKTRVRSREQYEKTAAALRGRKLSPEHIEKTRQGNLGRKQSQEEIERRRVATTGKKRSAEFCAHMSDVWTPERKAAQAEVTRRRNLEKIAARRTLMTPEQREKSEKRAEWRRKNEEKKSRELSISNNKSGLDK